jgi:hypothetical protein
VLAQSPDARQMIKEVYDKDASRNIYMRANFETYDQQGHIDKKVFTYRRIGTSADRKTLLVFTAPKEIRGVKLLSINRQGNGPRQYMYTPATQRVRNVVPQEQSARFLGTDFTFEDVGERVLDDFSYRLVEEGTVMENHKTYKVEAQPVDASRSQYKLIYYWVAQDIPVILHEELYDTQGREVRVLHSTNIRSVSGVSGARRTEMRTVADGTRTVLTIDAVKFNEKMDENLFVPEHLSSADDTGQQ